MATARRTKRQRERFDELTGFTRGELDDLRDKVENRFARANRVASHSVDTQGREMSPVDQRARLEAASSAPHMDATAYSERMKDPATADVRAYRKEKFGIDDLRTATAEQIEAARKDPEAFRRGRVTHRAPEDTQALAAAQAAAQGGSGGSVRGSAAGGKPASFTGYPGGRRAPSAGTGPLAAALSLVDQRKKLKRRGGPRQTVGGGSD
jgi:hypothetical protein